MLHGVVCDSQGRKMSKSLGNVIDPIHVINGRSLNELEEDLKLSASSLMSEKELRNAIKGLKKNFPDGIPRCGTDALRFSLVHNDPKSQQLNIDVQFVKTCAAFCNKIWQLTRFFLLSHERSHSQDAIFEKELNHNLGNNDQLDWLLTLKEQMKPEDKWILSRCASTVEEVNSYFEARDFHLAARSLRTFLYTNLCDVYVEIAKQTLADVTNPEFQMKYNVLKICLVTGLKLLHPIMPFITEELYQRIVVKLLPSSPNESIMTAQYPKEENWKFLICDKTSKDMDTALNFVTSVRNIKASYDLKRADRPEAIIKIKPSVQCRPFDKELEENYCKLISVLSPCDSVSIMDGIKDTGVDVPEQYNTDVSTWSSVDLPECDSTVYVNVSQHLNWSKEMQKLVDKRSKLLKSYEKLKKLSQKRKESVSQESTEHFNIQMKALDDKEIFLNKIPRENK